jgi:PAS domain S-box-containing protein
METIFGTPRADQSRVLEELDLPIPMLILDRGFRIRWISRTAITQLGIPSDQLLGRSLYEFFPASTEERAQHAELFQGRRNSLDLARVPLRLGCARTRYLSIHVRPIKSADGSVEAILGVGEDVTAQVEVEQTLRESERRLEVALWASKAAYWTIDTVNDHAEMSPQFFEMTAIPADEWCSPHPWNARMHPADLPRMRRIYEDYVSGRIDFYECEYRLRTPRGWLWLHDRGRVVERNSSGKVLTIAGTSQDASARKLLELALSEAAERERRRISHDLHDGLGQELTGIQYLLWSIANRLRLRGDPDADGVDQVLSLIRRAIGSTRLIAHGLAGPAVEPGGLATALARLAKEVSDTSGIRVACTGDHCGEDELSDATVQNLYRIVQEALTNARRHGHATQIVVATRRAGRALELSITDNGRGMPQPLNDTGGIGLKIMAHRAQTVGASFAVESDAAGGTRIVVTCPMAEYR